MASLPYPLNGQRFMAEWVWQGCHTLLQIAARIVNITSLQMLLHVSLPRVNVGGEGALSPSCCCQPEKSVNILTAAVALSQRHGYILTSVR